MTLTGRGFSKRPTTQAALMGELLREKAWLEKEIACPDTMKHRRMNFIRRKDTINEQLHQLQRGGEYERRNGHHNSVG